MDKPKVKDPLVMASMLIRALLLNTDPNKNKVHTDIGVAMWEDMVSLDHEVIPNYERKICKCKPLKDHRKDNSIAR